jgi:hypothetical protein
LSFSPKVDHIRLENIAAHLLSRIWVLQRSAPTPYLNPNSSRTSSSDSSRYCCSTRKQLSSTASDLYALLRLRGHSAQSEPQTRNLRL